MNDKDLEHIRIYLDTGQCIRGQIDSFDSLMAAIMAGETWFVFEDPEGDPTLVNLETVMGVTTWTLEGWQEATQKRNRMNELEEEFNGPKWI